MSARTPPLSDRPLPDRLHPDRPLPDRLTREEASWLGRPEPARLMAVLHDQDPGAPVADGQQARFVGGCVRNTLLGRGVDDLDVATTLTPEQVLERLERHGVKAVPTGLAHGTVTAVLGGTGFEITTLRRDVETDGRRAVVAFTTDWAEDAARRDFTLNALYLAPDGRLFDPVGGWPDLAARRVRFIGEADQRIREDYLRILRFFRMHAWYGAGPMDAQGLAACAALAQGLGGLAGERIQKEILKLMAAPEPFDAVTAMADAGIWAALMPELEAKDPKGLDIGQFQALRGLEHHLGLSVDPLRGLAALMDASRAEGVVARWRLSKADRTRLLALVGGRPTTIDLSPRSIRALTYRSGAALARDWMLLDAARHGRGAVDTQRLEDAVTLAASWSVPAMPLKGHDVMSAAQARGGQAGDIRGEDVGRLLRRLEDAWIASDFTLSQSQLRARLTAFLEEEG